MSPTFIWIYLVPSLPSFCVASSEESRLWVFNLWRLFFLFRDHLPLLVIFQSSFSALSFCFRLHPFLWSLHYLGSVLYNTAVRACLIWFAIILFLVTHLTGSFQASAAAASKSLQSCPTLFDPIDGSTPGSPVPGILQARILEWVAIPFSNAWKWKVKVKSLSRVWLLATPWTVAYQAPLSMGFSRQEYWSGVPLPSPFKASTRYKALYPGGRRGAGPQGWLLIMLPPHLCECGELGLCPVSAGVNWRLRQGLWPRPFILERYPREQKRKNVQRNRDKGKEGTKVSYWGSAPHQDSGKLSVPLSTAPGPGKESVYPLAPVAGRSRVPQGWNTWTLPGLCLCLGG